MDPVIIVGGGIGGLTLALDLHRAGIACRVYETAPEIAPLGVGINILPHATRELARLGLEERLARVAVTTRESVFFNRYGQLIYREPAGRHAGYSSPQFSIHRGDLQQVLLSTATERLGRDNILLGWRCVGVEQDDDGATALFADRPPQRGLVVIGCDGIHSVVRKQLHPAEGPPRYSGVNMWRGVTRWRPFLSGASMVRAGWLATGKMVIYPIRDNIDTDGRQLVNWVAEIETPHHQRQDWNRPARVEDFIGAFSDWHFDWLDVPALIRASDVVLEYPMVDQDPLDRWSFGRVSLLGDAAHPMVPRGSNGAGQAILDARALSDSLATCPDPVTGLRSYQDERLPATAQVVHANRSDPPDAILREVYLRTGDKPISNLDDVIDPRELAAIIERYKRVAGYAR